MERETCVQVRHPCESCDATGTRSAPAGSGHVSWSKRVDCPDCDGAGARSRWVPLSELKALLDQC